MGDIKAIDVAKWFIKRQYDSPRDTFDGNMKLQKLLYFAQLIHAADYNKLLFDDEMRAFENGTVVNNVRLDYKNNQNYLIEQAEKFRDFNNSEVNSTLEMTLEIFGDMTATELSDLNHEFDSWKIPYYSSITNQTNVYDKEKSIVRPFDEVFKGDLNNVKQMLGSYRENEDSMAVEVVNGVTFYYNANEIEFNDDILSELKDLDCTDEAYTVTIDQDQGLIIS
ncbi:type II toxin-antitoxin system antitoxin SocA domain-containing protein [Oceanobacillus sp. FSL W8-0428]|uniref:Panacea domain-containing protein n=1 Tax=Oceanobacillus sp. FSL W8-0428 TaxID=2921715 RepID=UPI0030FBE7E6